MSASVTKSDGTASSNSSVLPGANEQTPLLRSNSDINSDINTTDTSVEHLASRSCGPNAPTAESEDVASDPEAVRGKEDREIGTDIVGVISVLLLGI